MSLICKIGDTVTFTEKMDVGSRMLTGVVEDMETIKGVTKVQINCGGKYYVRNSSELGFPPKIKATPFAGEVEDDE